jgi:DNA-binding transcriptional regulator YhcF (GntR family)
MKHAWKKNNYECGLRYSTVVKETKLSRITVRRTLDTLEKLHIISTIRGRSGKTYKINQLFLKTESDSSIIYTNKNKKYKIDHSNVYKRAVLEETIYINNIENIIRDNRGNMDSLILNLSKLPLKILNSDTNNPYYVKLAKEKKAELERESKATYVHPQKIINELTKISKNSNPRYREKVAFNKRNNLDYKGRPKK